MFQQDVIKRGDWDVMDKVFNTDTMTYVNPNRPDLGTYHFWKTSPQCLYKTFPPSIYLTLKAWGRGEDEICVLCHHHGKHTGGPYMGIQPTGNELNVVRSEERRVGKECVSTCRSRWSPYH